MIKKMFIKLLGSILCKEVIDGFTKNGLNGAFSGAAQVRKKRGKILDEINTELNINHNSVKKSVK